MIKCLCCGKKIKKTMYNRIFCRKCAEYHKQRYSGLMNKNSRLQIRIDDLTKRLAMYE